MDDSELTQAYSDACQAFVLRDFEGADAALSRVLEEIESHQAASPTAADRQGQHEATDAYQELVRRAWILHITLEASRDDHLAEDHKKATSVLAGVHSRIKQYYGSTGDRPAQDTSRASPTSKLVLHPSLLVALSLAALKLNVPLFARQVLQDYFVVLLAQAAALQEAQDDHLHANGDASMLDASHADLSLSGIAGETAPPGASDAFRVGSQDAKGNDDEQGPRSASRTRSLHRLARIYSINVLGRSQGEWNNARAWIREKRDDPVALQSGLVSRSYAQTLLDSLDDAKEESEQEAEQARQAAKREKERQAEASRKHRTDARRTDRASAAESSQATKRDGSLSVPISSASASLASGHAMSGQSGTSPNGNDHRDTALPIGSEQETGFSAFRSHLSTFLAANHAQENGNATVPSEKNLSRRSQDAHRMTRQSTSTLDVFRAYLLNLASSRVLKSLLAFFIIFGFWRRRMARNGRKLDVRAAWEKVKEKVVQTVKMGGSLGFL